MNQEQIITLWNSGEAMFTSIAMKNLIDDFHEHHRLFFQLMAETNDDERLILLCQYAKQEFSFLRGAITPLSPHDIDNAYKPCSFFTTQQELYKTFVNNLLTDANSLPTDLRSRLLDRLWEFLEGFRADLQYHFPQLQQHECDSMPSSRNRQFMVFVTGVCNLHCPYCFSNALERKHMKWNDMLEVIEWAARNGVKSMPLCGGEPLMYNHLTELIELAYDKNIELYFATNFTVPLPEILRKKNPIGQLSLHLTPELWSNPSLLAQWEKNLDMCRELGIDIALRGNVCQINSREHEKWLEIIDRHNIKRLNMALTFPSNDKNNKWVELEGFKKFTPLLNEIINECDKRKVVASFAKPLPLCIWDEEMANHMLKNGEFVPTCNVNEDNFTRNVSIYPDMHISPCLGVESPRLQFTPSITWQDIENVVRPVLETKALAPLTDKCDKCFLYHRHLCQGACLSYKN